MSAGASKRLRAHRLPHPALLKLFIPEQWYLLHASLLHAKAPCMQGDLGGLIHCAAAGPARPHLPAAGAQPGAAPGRAQGRCGGRQGAPVVPRLRLGVVRAEEAQGALHARGAPPWHMNRLELGSARTHPDARRFTYSTHSRMRAFIACSSTSPRAPLERLRAQGWSCLNAAGAG